MIALSTPLTILKVCVHLLSIISYHHPNIYWTGAENGLAVSAVKQDGELAWVSVEAIDYTGHDTGKVRQVVLEAQGLCRAEDVQTEPKDFEIRDVDGTGLALNLTVGETVILYNNPTRSHDRLHASPPSFVVKPVEGQKDLYNFWGKRVS